MVQMHMLLLILCVVAKEAIQLLVEEASITQHDASTAMRTKHCKCRVEQQRPEHRGCICIYLQRHVAVKARFLSLTYVRSSSSL